MLEFDVMEDRVAHIRQRIAAACLKAQRPPEEVILLPVSKTFGVEAIRQAAGCGFARFGENKMQEIRQKAPELEDINLQWVMIGHLQTNKAREAARFASEVQSLDRLALAQELDRRLQREGRAIDVLVQVKTSPEPSKFGIEPSELPDFFKQLAAFDTLRVKGLMTLAVNTDDADIVRACFSSLRQWRDRLRDDGLPELSRLSMGMSGDFELAVAEGATEVRIGSAIFGSRPLGETARVTTPPMP